MRAAVDPASHHSGAALSDQLLDRSMKRRRVSPEAVEGDPALGVDQVSGIGQPAVLLVNRTGQIVNEYLIGNALFSTVAFRIEPLLLPTRVGRHGRAGMGLADRDIKKVDMVTPVRMQLLQGLDRARGDGSTE